MRFRILLFIFAGVLLTSSVAVGTEKDKEAQAAFDRAVKLFRNGSFEDAANAFRQANSLKPSGPLLYNIGQSEAAAKRYGLAYDAFEEYLSLGGDDITYERRAEVLAELDRLTKMIGSIEVFAPKGCTVSVDDMDRGVTPLPGRIKIAVGVVHKIEIKKHGKIIYTDNVKVSFGEVLRRGVTAESDAEVAAAPTQTEGATPAESETAPTERVTNPSQANTDPANRYRPATIAGLATVISGGAALGAAVATGVIALQKNTALKSECVDSVCENGDQGEIHSRDNLALSTDILIGVGVTTAVVGTVLLIWSKKKSKSGETTGLWVIPFAAPKIAGMGLSGAF